MRSSAPERSIAAIVPGFWPGLGSLARAAGADGILLLDQRPFRASDGLNRGCIRRAAGETWLTVPVRSAPPGTPLHAIALVSPDAWAPRVMRGIEHAYEEAPYFEHYRCELARLLFHGWTRLVDLNEAMLRLLLQGYQLPQPLTRESEQPDAGPPRHAVLSTRSLDRGSDRSALDALLWHGPGARALIAPSTRPGSRPIRLRVFADRARQRHAPAGLGA
jgi:hypothetical protein